MEFETSALSALIGTRVRQERQTRGWTLDELARAAGVSRRMIVSVEQGAVNPSLGTLLRISEALGLALPALVETTAEAPDRVRITRAGNGLALWSGDAGGRGLLVAGADVDGAFELWEWTLEPGESRASEPHTAGTRELIHVHSGTLTLDVGGTAHALVGGDAVAFHGDVAHCYANHGDSPVRFSLAVREPSAARARSALA